MTLTVEISSDTLTFLINLKLSSQSLCTGSSLCHMYTLRQSNVMLRHASKEMLPEFLEQLTSIDNPWDVIGLCLFPSMLALIIKLEDIYQLQVHL